jgi:hypothetical protein
MTEVGPSRGLQSGRRRPRLPCGHRRPMAAAGPLPTPPLSGPSQRGQIPACCHTFTGRRTICRTPPATMPDSAGIYRPDDRPKTTSPSAPVSPDAPPAGGRRAIPAASLPTPRLLTPSTRRRTASLRSLLGLEGSGTLARPRPRSPGRYIELGLGSGVPYVFLADFLGLVEYSGQGIPPIPASESSSHGRRP